MAVTLFITGQYLFLMKRGIASSFLGFETLFVVYFQLCWLFTAAHAPGVLCGLLGVVASLAVTPGSRACRLRCLVHGLQCPAASGKIPSKWEDSQTQDRTHVPWLSGY